MEEVSGMVKSGGRETFWACLIALAVLAGFTVSMGSDIGLQIFKASIMPVMVLGLGVFGFHKASGIMAGKVK